MSIYEKIAKDRMRKELTMFQRGMYAVIQSEICVDGKPMSDDDAIKKMMSMVKTCDKNVKLFEKNGRCEKINEELDFRGMIEEYIPEEMTKQATPEDVKNTLTTLGLPCSMRSMKDVMIHLKKGFPIVDGGMVKDILSKG